MLMFIKCLVLIFTTHYCCPLLLVPLLKLPLSVYEYILHELHLYDNYYLLHQ